jgi:biotin synthase-like enzyme
MPNPPGHRPKTLTLPAETIVTVVVQGIAMTEEQVEEAIRGGLQDHSFNYDTITILHHRVIPAVTYHTQTL